MPFVRKGRRSQDKGAPYPKKKFYNVPIGSDVFAEWREMRESLGFSSDDKLAQYLLNKEQTELGEKVNVNKVSDTVDVETELEIEELPSTERTIESDSKNKTTKNDSNVIPIPVTIQSKPTVVMGNSFLSETKSNATSLRTYLKSRAEQEKKTTDKIIVSQIKTQPPPERPKPRVTIVYDDSQIPLILECESG